ncbi:MAG: hypothetical protein AAGJ38_05985 [Planctomycetota bacterium]
MKFSRPTPRYGLILIIGAAGVGLLSQPAWTGLHAIPPIAPTLAATDDDEDDDDDSATCMISSLSLITALGASLWWTSRKPLTT